ncbi:TonB-dependent receptor [Sphingomonas crusticola]|uniref:TonB-dependent receptor n=1 Tax=Sphingomonas crusticola TaxID=1697973 RepID=UPI000E22DF05|nr:TonB-dependent receptor [Sphingomonas crusticola]
MSTGRAAMCTVSLVALVAGAAPAAARGQSSASQAASPANGPDRAPGGRPAAAVSANSLNGDQAGADATEEEIVVTGVRASLRAGLAVKREATQIVESVVAEDVGKLPDNNVVEALQRVTGVQVTDRGAGETGTISIRGLPDITTTWNGRNIFTASGRQFALADIPANLVRRIDVYKTRAASQIETGIAGQVDVFTRRPFDFDGLAFSAVGRGIYLQQADKINPNVSALISDRWNTGIGDLGALVNVSYARTRYKDQGVTAGALVPFASPTNPPAGWTPLERIQPTDGRAPGQQLWVPGLDAGLPEAPGSTLLINGVQSPYLLSRDAVFQNALHGDRKRPAVNVALQWAPNSSSEYTAEFFWDGYRNTTFNDLFFTFVDWWGNLGPNPASTITLYPDSNMIKTRQVGSVFGFNSGDVTKSSTDSFVYALSGKWDIGDRLKLRGDLSYQDSTFKSSFAALRTTRVADQINVDLNSGNGITGFHFNDDSILTNPAIWTVAEFYDNANKNKGNARTAQLDGDYDAGEGLLRKISFGVRYDDRRATEASRTQDAPGLGVPLSSLDPGLQYIEKGFFDGRADVPRTWVVANGYYVTSHLDDIRSLYRNSVDPGIQLSDQLTLTQNFHIRERTSAAYVQGDFQQDIAGRPLRLQAGVRYVGVKTDMDFRSQLDGSVSGASKKVHSFLPSVTVRYDVTDKLRFRFNYGRTLRRPNFVDLNPNYILTGDLTNVGYGSGTGGNPNLRPTKATNYDLGAEWYFDRDSAIYATLFQRNIDGLVVSTARLINIPNTNYNTQNFVINAPDNASNGKLKGAEIGLVYFPKFLPGLLNGLGVQGSLTVLDSSQTIPVVDAQGNVTGHVQTPFFGVSKLSYNVTLAYDHGPIGTRLSYVWRKSFIHNNEARLFANPIGIWRVPEKSLDFQLSYNVSKAIALTFDATNLTNELDQSYYAFGNAGSPSTTNFGTTIRGRQFALGARLSFN